MEDFYAGVLAVPTPIPTAPWGPVGQQVAKANMTSGGRPKKKFVLKPRPCKQEIVDDDEVAVIHKNMIVTPSEAGGNWESHQHPKGGDILEHQSK